MSEPDKSEQPVSMRKGDPAHADPAPSGRPRTVLAAVVALGLSGVAAFGAGITLYGQRSWLTSQTISANSSAIKSAASSAAAKASRSHADVAAASSAASTSAAHRWPTTAPQVHHSVSQQQTSGLLMAIVFLAALGFISSGVYRGRYWSRWGTVGFWFLASLATPFGIGGLLLLGRSAPGSYKAAIFLAAALFVVAVILVNVRASTAYFALSKPAPREGVPARRGLFAPRPPAHTGKPGPAGAKPTAKSTLTSSAATRGEAYVQKQRSKKRNADAEAVARGAELARSRAKASKSRRGTER